MAVILDGAGGDAKPAPCIKSRYGGLSRSSELDRNAGGGDAPQQGAVEIGTLDGVDFKIEADDRVGAVVFSLADQGAHRGLAIGVGAGRVRGPPARGRFDS